MNKIIVLLINDLKGNGAERVVLTLANNFQKQGYSCHIICFKNLQELPINEELNIHIFPMKFFRFIPRSIRAKTIAPLLDRFILKKAKKMPDLILSNLLPVDRIMCNSKLNNVYCIIHNTISLELLKTDDSTKKEQILSIIKDIYTKKPLIGVSKGVSEDLKKLFKNHQNITHIYNPIDVAYIEKEGNKPNPINLSNYLVHVGKFKEAKRHDRLLKAFAISKTTTPLVLVGQGSLMEEAKTLATELKINHLVHFVGFHANPYPIIANAKAMVLASDFEGLALVILEALVLKTPVISTNCPSGPSEILPEKNLTELNETSLAEKIKDISNNPAKYQSSFPEIFQAENSVTKYLALINKN